MADITCLVLPHEGLLLTICMYSVNRADMGLKEGGDQFLIISSYLNFCKAPTSWVMLATWATLYRVFSVDSFSMMKLEARMPRCQKGFMSGSMWPWLSEGSLEFSVTSHLKRPAFMMTALVLSMFRGTPQHRQCWNVWTQLLCKIWLSVLIGWNCSSLDS